MHIILKYFPIILDHTKSKFGQWLLDSTKKIVANRVMHEGGGIGSGIEIVMLRERKHPFCPKKKEVAH